MTAAMAGPYSNLFVFGDSLSDSGNDFAITGGTVPAAAIYTDGRHVGRFTNGLNYADRLAGLLDLSLTPSLAGGTAYAYGGARTASVNPGLVAFGALSFNQQVDRYLAGHAAADPNALYVLWIGANDLSDAITATALGGGTTVIPNAVAGAMAGIGGAIGALASRGAQHFLIPDVPDLSLIPAVRERDSAGLSFLARSASQAFNASLAATIDQGAFASLDIRSLSVFDLQARITADPAAYGFGDVTSACFSGDVNGGPRAGGAPPTRCADPAAHLYFDYEHPTDALHAQLAVEAFAAVVPEPGRTGLLLTGLLLVGLRRRRWRRGCRQGR